MVIGRPPSPASANTRHDRHGRQRHRCSYPIIASGAASPIFTMVFVCNGGHLTISGYRAGDGRGRFDRKDDRGYRREQKTSEDVVVRFSGGLNAAAAQNLGDYALATVAHGKQKSKSAKC